MLTPVNSAPAPVPHLRPRAPRLRTTLGVCVVAALVALTGCQGSDPDADRATEEAPTSQQPTTPGEGGTPTDPFDGFEDLVVSGDAGVEKIALLSHSPGRGQVSRTARRVDVPAALQRFTERLPDPLAAKVQREVKRLRAGDGAATYAAVVEIGCAPPVGVRIDRVGAALRVRTESSTDTISCLVPVAYVLVFTAVPPPVTS